MGRWHALLPGLVLALAAVAVGCASESAPAAGQWSRTYARKYERVWQAALAALGAGGYDIAEQDPARGYIRAESGEREAYRRVVLEVFVLRRPESVRVDVQASGGAAFSQADHKRLARPVLDFLDELDARLRS